MGSRDSEGRRRCRVGHIVEQLGLCTLVVLRLAADDPDETLHVDAVSRLELR